MRSIRHVCLLAWLMLAAITAATVACGQIPLPRGATIGAIVRQLARPQVDRVDDLTVKERASEVIMAHHDTVILPTADIAARRQTNVSIMPDGLFDQMKPDEVRDLIAYLRSKEQVPIPK